jgi:hypothetical protein
VVDAENEQIVKSSKPVSGAGKKRFSQRKHTIQNTSATVTRLKQSQQKKVKKMLRHSMQLTSASTGFSTEEDEDGD